MRSIPWPRKTALTGLALAAGASAVLAGGSPAAAQDTNWVCWASAGSTVGCVRVTTSHTKIEVCDTAKNNIGVYAEFYLKNNRSGEIAHDVVSDSNGADPGCGTYWTETGWVITSFRGIERGTTSSPWITA
ncbi:hypothetical protein [Streptomyces sp. NPDC127114]|uniref:hypothetical protein n=1 Tax=Streptomyces sp. NPDC127114 TaxID=3345366 RepID=UPI003640DB5A